MATVGAESGGEVVCYEGFLAVNGLDVTVEFVVSGDEAC